MPVPEKQLSLLRSLLNELVPLSDAAWADAAPLFSYRRFPASSHVVEAGFVVDEVHFLLTGMARYYYLDRDGREFNKGFSGRGQVLASILSLVTGSASPFSIQALFYCECLSLPYSDFLLLSERYRDWADLRVRMLELLAMKKERREADFLLLSAAERYEKFLQEYTHVAESIPNYHIASYLGITEVALSRIRKRLKLTRVNVSDNA